MIMDFQRQDCVDSGESYDSHDDPRYIHAKPKDFLTGHISSLVTDSFPTFTHSLLPHQST